MSEKGIFAVYSESLKELEILKVFMIGPISIIFERIFNLKLIINEVFLDIQDKGKSIFFLNLHLINIFNVFFIKRSKVFLKTTIYQRIFY